MGVNYPTQYEAYTVISDSLEWRLPSLYTWVAGR